LDCGTGTGFVTKQALFKSVTGERIQTGFFILAQNYKKE
jgi:hypothetical protein